jgi:1-acyl-sn-glycerol-3-phosphate acyltransferase
VRIGVPRAPETTDAGQLRADVLDLLGRGPARRRTSAVWARVARLVSGPRGLLVAFAWGFAEALSWPVMAEMTLVFLAAAVPSRVPALASSIVVGSVAGVLLNARLTAAGWWLPAPLTTERMQAAARADLADGAPGILHQALSGIPVKLYARAAGELGTDPWSLVVWAEVERGLRMAAAGLVVWLLARWLQPWLRRCYGIYLVLTAAGFAGVLGLIVAAWS